VKNDRIRVLRHIDNYVVDKGFQPMNSDKDSSVTKLFGMTAKRLEYYIAKIILERGLGFEQGKILFLLAEKQGRININEIAQIALKDKATISRQILCLEKKGFCKKHINKQDKRVTYVEITEQGHKKLNEIGALLKVVDNIFNNSLNKNEQETLKVLLSKILKAIS